MQEMTLYMTQLKASVLKRNLKRI